MIAGRATTRLAHGRRRGTRLALGALGGAIAAGALLVAMAALGERLLTEPPSPLPPLSIIERTPPPPPPPPPLPEEPPPPPPPTALPTIPPMDLSFDAQSDPFTLPPMELVLDAVPIDSVIELPRSVPEGVPGLDGATGARRAQRLFVPDLQRYYPRRLARRGVEGRTRVRVRVDAEGAVSEVQVISSDPPGAFDDAARRAVGRLRYEPATDRAGNPIPSEVEETLVWTIER